MPCIFCCKPNENEGEENSICSNCVQKLLLCEIEELKRVYRLALKKSPQKAEALQAFIGPIVRAEEGYTFVRKRPVALENRKHLTRRRPLQK